MLDDAHNAATDAASGITDTQKRRAAAEPVLTKLDQWVEAQRPHVVDDSPIAKGDEHLVNHREPLSRFLHDGQLRLDNNFSEIELRRQVVGRHNWTRYARPRVRFV